MAHIAFVLVIAQLLHAATFGVFHSARWHHSPLFRGPNQARGQAAYSSLSFAWRHARRPRSGFGLATVGLRRRLSPLPRVHGRVHAARSGEPTQGLICGRAGKRPVR